MAADLACRWWQRRLWAQWRAASHPVVLPRGVVHQVVHPAAAQQHQGLEGPRRHMLRCGQGSLHVCGRLDLCDKQLCTSSEKGERGGSPRE